MKLIVLTSPQSLPEEHLVINALFEAGLACLHVRKPDYTIEETEDFIRKVKPQYMKRLVIHQHYKLIGKYNLKGIHLKENYYRNLDKAGLRDLMKTAERQRMTISLSLHNLEDVQTLKEQFSYLFLSPVFQSISKENYKPREDILAIPAGLKNEVIALGGITAENIGLLNGSNYSGTAILGEIWKDFETDQSAEKATGKFRIFKQAWEKIEWKQKDPIC